jgi:hypothetical protein
MKRTFQLTNKSEWRRITKHPKVNLKHLHFVSNSSFGAVDSIAHLGSQYTSPVMRHRDNSIAGIVEAAKPDRSGQLTVSQLLNDPLQTEGSIEMNEFALLPAPVEPSHGTRYEYDTMNFNS